MKEAMHGQKMKLLILFAGLSGAGKTTIARAVARELGAVFLRIDAIEQALRDGGLGDGQIGGMGYRVAQRVASENLRLGRLVVADMVNPWQLTREAWRQVAREAGAIHLDVEVVCSDQAEHRRRVESRVSDIDGLRLPTWQEVLAREYHAWDVEPLRIDSAKVGADEAAGLIAGEVRRRVSGAV